MLADDFRVDGPTHDATGLRVSVVIPVLNEAQNLPHVFDRLPDGMWEVVVVDGGSTDGSADVVRTLRPDALVLDQQGRGKGDALLLGFAACTGDVVVMIDADGSTDPAEIPRFVDALAAGADFAKGSRFAAGGGSSDITAVRRHGNRLLQRAVNALFATHYTDLCYGYNAFWRRHLPTLIPARADVSAPARRMQLGDGFEIETLLNVRAARAGLEVVEVPSFEGERIHGCSRLNTVRDGLRALRVIVHESARRAPVVDLVALTSTAVCDTRPCEEHGAAWDCCCPLTATG
jgi:glycosyltransferase involved in cell wall biosynthesis